jgi:TonB family protein
MCQRQNESDSVIDIPAHFPGRPDSAACVSLPRNYSTDFLKIYPLNENKNSLFRRITCVLSIEPIYLLVENDRYRARQLRVDEQGRTKHVRVLRGVGDGLDEKALEAVKQYKFSPAMEGGKPVLVELKTEVNFKIF